MPPTLEQLERDVKGLEKQINPIREQLFYVAEQVDKIEVTVALQAKELEGHKENISTLTAETEKAIKHRAEFKDLWEAQKLEAKAIKVLRENRGDPEIQALIRQKGLEIVVAKEDLQALAVSKEELKKVLGEYPDDEAGNYARLFHSLAYAYVLMAMHYKTARDHVSAVVAEKSLTEILLEAGITALKAAVDAAVQAGLAALTQGVSSMVMPALLSMLKIPPEAKTGTMNVIGTTDEGETFDGTVDVTGKDEATDTQKVVRDKLGEAPGTLVDLGAGLVTGGLDAITGGRISKLLDMDTPENTTPDPYDYFMQKEQNLRKVAAFIGGTTDEKVLQEISVELNEKMSLAELKNDPNWQFFMKVHANYDALNEIWERVSDLLAVSMRRLCWRLFCRTQWAKAKNDYTVSVVAPETADKEGYNRDGPATEWHYKIWTGTSTLVMPRKWEKICADFKGPEHDPDHAFTVKRGLVNRAHKLLEDNAWISMAAVQCCQIRRYNAGFLGQGWDIDLEKLSHFGGEEGEKQECPLRFTDKVLVYGDTSEIDGLEAYLRKIRVKGGIKVQISEIRFGREATGIHNRWTRATGKKGTLTSPNNAKSALPIVKDMKITVMIKRTDSLGEPTRSTVDARVHVYRAERGKKHDDGKDCDPKNGCWYCKHGKDAKDYKETYRLTEVDKGTNQAILTSDDGMNYVNFPHPDNKKFVNEPGLYCIRLDPRMDRRTSEGTGTLRDLQYHVSDEWWFKILDKVDQTQAPNMPKIAWDDVVRGKKEIPGTYTKKKPEEPDTKTLIHVFVDGKMYGPKEVTPTGSDPVKWSIKIDALRGGEWIYTTATLPASDERGAVQSEGENVKGLVLANLPKIEPIPKAGETAVRGTSNAVEGVTIRVYVTSQGSQYDSAEKGVTELRGERSEDEGDKKGTISWSVEKLPQLLPKQSVKAQIWSDKTGKPLRVTNKTDGVEVLKADAPQVNPPKPGDTTVSGTSNAAAGLKVWIKATDAKGALVAESSSELGGPQDSGTGNRSWTVGKSKALPPLMPGMKVAAQLKSDGGIACSDASAEVPVPKLAKPVVDGGLTPGNPITGTATIPASLVDHSEVWVNVNSEWIAAAKCTPGVDGSVSWELTSPPDLLPDSSVWAQIFGKAVKGQEQAEFSPMSADGVTVGTLEAPMVNDVKAGDTSISGSVTHADGATILVYVDNVELSQAAAQTKSKSDPDTISWVASKLNLKNAKKGDKLVLVPGTTKIKVGVFIKDKRISEWAEVTVKSK